MAIKFAVTDNAENRTTNRGNFLEKKLGEVCIYRIRISKGGLFFFLESGLFKQGCARFPLLNNLLDKV